MSSSDRRSFLAAVLATLPLAACGFEPLYSQGGRAVALQNQIDVDFISGRAGYFIKQRLEQRFGAPDTGARYDLAIQYSTSARALTITTANDTVRLSVEGTAIFTLTDRTTGQVVANDTVTADASYAAPTNAGATLNTSPAATRVSQENAQELVAQAVAEGIADRILLASDQFAS
ncbi:hypothetical protein [Pontivivens insulae]|uniref:LPS-assembly lipoprotein LptE n=1 Tax=Pontivivens insulae TaxID=1639689 RepID=A0A2R8AEN9_9RHOB|nr:hypothetical protein [Pontivivens insulae]RED11926.1 LPS-assembly lipoprotein [Pontivivens insulae]SPF30682.1 hypothetical protein POI8812_03024 [Pontivivens insulae]